MATDILQLFYLENKFLQATAIFIVFFIIAKLIVFISQKVILKITKKTKTKVDDLIVEKTNRKISLILLLIGVKFAILPLSLAETIIQIIQSTVSTFMVIVMTLIVINVLDIVIEHWGKKFAQKTSSKVDDQVIILTHRFSRALFFLLSFLFILQIWDIKIAALLASLGIAGLAIAFALQNSLGNIFGGISLILDKSIRVGDRIELESGETGIVQDVGLRSTKIKTWGNQIIVVPNGKLSSSIIKNYIRRDKKTRVVVSFGVAYGTKLEKVEKVILLELKKIKDSLKDPEPSLYFKGMSDFSLDFDAKFWVDSVNKSFMAKQDANVRIYNALNKAKINIPFPTQTVYVKK